MKRVVGVPLVIASVVWCALSIVLAAPGDRGSWELGLFGGYGFLDDYAGADPDDGPLWGGRVGCFLDQNWSLETSYQQLSSEVGPSAIDFDINSARLNGLYNFRPGNAFRPFVTFGAGYEGTEAGAFAEKGGSANVGIGGRWYLGRIFGLRLDGRYVYTDVGGSVDDWQGNVETTAGLLFAFGGGPPADEDGDGVRDGKDRCPGTPRGALVDARGCPQDSDGDGVYDGIDMCPGTEQGCAVDERGCPTDGDGDGVVDCHDKCAGTPKSCAVDADGCAPDEDGDGVCDGLDRCPGTPAGREVDEKGCELKFDERGTLRLEGVTFAFNSDRLTDESKTILDSVAASLAEWPELRVEVGGHTDSQGPDAYNHQLSQKRADAVRDYLVARGVPATQLTARGYGESRPLADNATEAGRARNRRVELTRKD